MVCASVLFAFVDGFHFLNSLDSVGRKILNNGGVESTKMTTRWRCVVRHLGIIFLAESDLSADNTSNTEMQLTRTRNDFPASATLNNYD